MTVEVSRPEKVLFPGAGVTKRDLAQYYARVAEHMLPHVRGRPVAMQRFPDGVTGHGFFHKEVPGHFPEEMERVSVRKEGGTVTHVLIEDRETLVYLADQAVITPHVWLSRADDLERPDRLVIDLDPAADDFGAVRSAARAAGALMRELGLEPFAMTSGSRGIHVTVPLERRDDFDAVRAFAREAAAVLARREPDLLTVEQRKAKRGGPHPRRRHAQRLRAARRAPVRGAGQAGGLGGDAARLGRAVELAPGPAPLHGAQRVQAPRAHR